MRLDAANLPSGSAGYRVIDDATGQEIKFVLWVDDASLEYATFGGTSIWGLPVEHVVKVTAVRINFAAREIHVNDVPVLLATDPTTKPRACTECCQAATCERINYCAQYRCGFGEARKP